MRLCGFALFALLLGCEQASSAAAAVPVNQADAAASASVISAESADPDASDPQASQMREMDRRYHATMARGLRASTDPRDWAALALSRPFSTSEAERVDLDQLAEQARLAAPDDLLVQWIALRLSSTTAHIDHAAALAAVQRLEPDNAAVWMETLAQSSQRNDSGGVDDALGRMAASTRCDEHLVDLLKAQLDVYKRYPPPDEYAAILAATYPDMAPQAMSHVAAMAVVSAIALPTYQGIVKACTINSATVENVPRSGNCTTIGRLMAARGTNLLTNRIGSSVLRVAGTYTDADIAEARVQDWIYQQDAAFLQANYPEQVPPIDMRMDDWIESHSELEAMRREVARAGMDVVPPADWSDDRSPLSPARIAQEQLRRSATASSLH